MNKLKALMAMALLFCAAFSANALIVNVTATADNILGGGLCAKADCDSSAGWGAFGASPNSNWTVAQSWSLDLGAGTHWFLFDVVNSRPPGSGNPAALLAQISWAGNTQYSSSAWEVETSPGNWSAATEYGLNGATNIWTRVNGGAVAGISGNANWILGTSNFSNVPEVSRIRTGITIQTLFEPGTLVLFTIGVFGLIAVRRFV